MALDTADWQDAFMSLWQALEIMGSRDVGFKNENLIKRLKTLLIRIPPEVDVLKTDWLEVARDRRNALVHQGTFTDDGMVDVSLLKSIVEYAIMVLTALYKSKVCTTWGELEGYYENVLKHPDDFSRDLKMMEAIKRMRTGGRLKAGIL